MSDNYGLEQAKAQLSSIIGMVAALEVDYDRLEELRDEREAYENPELGNLASDEVRHIAWEQENPDDAEELQELESAAGDYENSDDAQQAIQEDPLEIQVRSGWHEVAEELQPAEFYILLCTGGPAVRIIGELDANNTPSRAWLEYQDWGTPWTELAFTPGQGERDAVLTYCRQFYFGE